MITRRNFVKAFAVLGGLALMPLDGLGQHGSVLSLADPQTWLKGELYGGFLLLPDGAPVPPVVKYPERGIPIVCGVGEGSKNDSMVVHSVFNSSAELAQEVSFPIYTLDNVPQGLHSSDVSLIRHKTGEVFMASVNFASSDKTDRANETISIMAQPDFPRPFPLWSSDPVEPDGPSITLKKVSFLPSPGIMVVIPTGFVFHWINKDIFYTLMAEHILFRQDFQALASSLAVVQ